MAERMKASELKDPYDRIIAVRVSMVKRFGSTNCAMYLQQLLYWNDRAKRTDGFIYKTKDEIEDETGLTRKKQDASRRMLEKRGLLETKLLKANGAPTLHYRVNVRLVQEVLNQKP